MKSLILAAGLLALSGCATPDTVVVKPQANHVHSHNHGHNHAHCHKHRCHKHKHGRNHH